MPSDHELLPRGEEGTPLRVPREGELIGGKYRVEGVIGLGAMGMVISARHEHLGERVALKTLLPHIARDVELRKRFQREAQAAFRLQNEHVCRVFDAGSLDDGSPFLVMEFLKGDSLAGVLARAGRLRVEEAVDYVIQACDGIAAAHDLGIIHRDIKPANLFLTKRPDGTRCVKVIDFGISKLKVESQGSVTGMNSFLGSPIYSAPEQLNSAREVTPASDVWSLGVVLYQFILGRYPFDGDFSTIGSLFAAVLAGPVKPSLREPSFPRDLESVIMSALQMDPQKRCPSARAFARALIPFQARSSSATLIAAPPVPSEEPTTDPMAGGTPAFSHPPVTPEPATHRDAPRESSPETMSVPPPPIARASPSSPSWPEPPATPPALYSHPQIQGSIAVADTRLSAAREFIEEPPSRGRGRGYWLAGIGGLVVAALGLFAVLRPTLVFHPPASPSLPSLSTTVPVYGAPPPESASPEPTAPAPLPVPQPNEEADASLAPPVVAPSSERPVTKPTPSTKSTSHAVPRSTASAKGDTKSDTGPSLMKDRHGL